VAISCKSKVYHRLVYTTCCLDCGIQNSLRMYTIVSFTLPCSTRSCASLTINIDKLYFFGIRIGNLALSSHFMFSNLLVHHITTFLSTKQFNLQRISSDPFKPSLNSLCTDRILDLLVSHALLLLFTDHHGWLPWTWFINHIWTRSDDVKTLCLKISIVI
jgi:hypothetical protein